MRQHFLLCLRAFGLEPSSDTPADSTSLYKTVKLACKPKNALPELKYVDAIVAKTQSGGDGALHDIYMTLFPRLHEPNHVTMFKALLVLHTTIRNGATDNVLSHLSKSDVLNLRSIYHGNKEQRMASMPAPTRPMDMDNIRSYARYLDCRIRAYRDLKHDKIKIQSEVNRNILSFKGARKPKLLRLAEGSLWEARVIHRMIDALIGCKFYGGSLDERLCIATMRMLIEDLVILFQARNDGITTLLEQYLEMSHSEAEQALNIYQYSRKQTSDVLQYLATTKNTDGLHDIAIPRFRLVPTSLAIVLMEHLQNPNFDQVRWDYGANIMAARAKRAALSTATAGSSNISSLFTRIDRDADEEFLKAEIEAGGIPAVSAPQGTDAQDSIHERVLQSLALVLRAPEKTKAMRGLKGDRAQLMIDFLYSVLLQLEPTPNWLRKHTLIALYKLSKSSQLYPRHYVLRDITLATVEDGGGFCDIYRGSHQGQDLCLKVVRIFQKVDTDATLKLFAKEAILWGQLVHHNIVPFYGVYYLDEERKRMCLVSPWMKNGNIVEYLKRHPSVPRKPLIYDIINGLGYLHTENVIHGDLKGVNVLVTNSGRACIADFGLSSVLTDNTLGHTIATSALGGATYRWAAPELLDDSDSRSTRASDIWAFGCVCYQVLTRQVPFHELSSDGPVIGKILRGGLPTRPTGDSAVDLDKIDDETWDLVKQCWNIDPWSRPTCQHIIQRLDSEVFSGADGEKIRERSAYENTVFQDAMRAKADISIDSAKIDKILNEL